MKTVIVSKYLFYGLIVGIILVSTIFVLAMKDGNSCISNPMIYGAKKAITDDSGPIMCSCSFLSPTYAPFYFDDKEIGIKSPLAP